MKSAPPRRTKAPSGITFVELTVVLAVLLSLVGMLMSAANAWRRGAARADCVMTLRNVQVGVRSYQNLYGYVPGKRPLRDHDTYSIVDHLLAKGFINESTFAAISVSRRCPGGGNYVIPDEEHFPVVGKLYATCSLERSLNHRIPGDNTW